MARAWSMRGRLTSVVVAVVALVLVALAFGLYVGTRRAAWRLHDDNLLSRARALAVIVEHDDDGYEMNLPPESQTDRPSYLEVWRPDGGVLARSPALAARDLPRLAPTAAAPAFADIRLPDGRDGRAVAIEFVPRDEAKHTRVMPCTLVLATGTEDADAAVATARTWFVALAAIALAAIAAITAWSLARGLAPLRRLAVEIERLDDTRLGTPIALADQPAELAAPVNKLNELLGRLAASFAREREFTADVSHELRTPLAGLRTLLEVTALAERSTTEYKAALVDALAIVLQLVALVENLLTLARLDAGQLELDTRDVALRELVDDCWRPHADRATARGLVFRNTIPAGTTARTDREKLRIVVANLLGNAAEYTAAGGWIEVATGADALLDVVDSGPPIPPDQLERIFDRLWRGDTSRAGGGVHCGVGLALARALCDCLALDLGATTRADGSVCFRIRSRGLARSTPEGRRDAGRDAA